MINRISRGMTTFVSRYMPEPLVLAVLLSIVIFFCAWGFTEHTPIQLVNMWGDGFWNLLSFSMQMAMVVVTGNALASAPQIRRFLGITASIAQTPSQGVMLVTFMSALACMINWGFGLVVGAMFAKEVARRIQGSDYALLIACAYIGFMTWGGGFSGSMPLQAATPNNPIAHLISSENNPLGIVPVNQTLFTGYNIFIVLMLLTFITKMMNPKGNEVRTVDPALLQPDPDFTKRLDQNATFAEKIEESRLLAYLIAGTGFGYLAITFYQNGFSLTINTVNLIFLMTGILLHSSPAAYVRAITNAARSTAGILIQFPFYAGMQLMMEHSGLGGMITEFFVNISNKETFPLLTFFSSALVNFAVPSGGGHWVVQGPFVIPAALSLEADLGKSVMAIAYGDMWANMAQPFWVLPALGIAGLGVRDIMGYCMTALIFTTPIFVIGLYFL
ncbi:TIGR00366 family protein [Rodentibacter pneumotropicus]|uniref:TIGR00366 family protein n=1 Tax=Rodentibacter pneumotropicus TaxID=758 RepID=A0AAW5LDQ1_9PAST|nr:TIGR00366 family protein [Rodentibacter pneumotropicus]MCQ9121885.1 TIGR00366 family protein [Rodentibacter pneumotropicus]OOF68067.1 TIGR00366 family protein [Rodentibacter pneumotropicus]